MAWSASVSFSISTKANPRDRPVSRSVMIRALLTAPYLSNKLRTASSVALKLRLPTKIFFTSLPPDNLKAGSSGRQQRRERRRAVATDTQPDSQKLFKCALNISRRGNGGKALEPRSGGQPDKRAQRGGADVQKPSIAGGLL